MDILKLIVSNTDNCSQFNVNEFQVICVDVQMPGHGDVQGNKYGSRKLCISRQNTNHFAPLIRDNSRGHTSGSNHSIQGEATSSNATPSLVSRSHGSSSFDDLSMCAATSSTNASSGSASDVMNNDASSTKAVLRLAAEVVGNKDTSNKSIGLKVGHGLQETAGTVSSKAR